MVGIPNCLTLAVINLWVGFAIWGINGELHQILELMARQAALTAQTTKCFLGSMIWPLRIQRLQDRLRVGTLAKSHLVQVREDDGFVRLDISGL